MQKTNNYLRRLAKDLNVPLWAVASALGISEQTLYRHWRRELRQSEKERIEEIIRTIAKTGV